MNDILERLRKLWVDRVGTDDELVSIYREAADEIEQLRKELNKNDIYKCTLCNTWDRPVNLFKDCKICSDAQYGD